MLDDRRMLALIELLLNATAYDSERDDAAMDLVPFDAEEVEVALGRVAASRAESQVLVETCIESLVEIWTRKRRVRRDVLLQLAPESQAFAARLMMTSKDLLLSELPKALDE